MATLTKSKLISVGLMASLTLLPLYAESAEAEQQYRVKMANADTSRAKIVNVKAQVKNSKLLITGKVQRKQRTMQVSLGHIDVAILDSKGNVIAEATGDYTPKMVHKEMRKASQFKIKLATTPPKDSIVKVAYHKNVARRTNSAQHSHNIAAQ